MKNASNYSIEGIQLQALLLIIIAAGRLLPKY